MAKFRVIEKRTEGIGIHILRAPKTVSVGIVLRTESGCTALRPGNLNPDGLETPLDDGGERVGAKLRSATRDKLLKHPADSICSGQIDSLWQDAVQTTDFFP